MTETYKAGEIEVSVKLDTSALKGEFDALKKDLKSAGKDAAYSFTSGFESGQMGKQINGAIAKGLEPGVSNLVDVFLPRQKKRSMTISIFWGGRLVIQPGNLLEDWVRQR